MKGVFPPPFLWYIATKHFGTRDAFGPPSASPIWLAGKPASTTLPQFGGTVIRVLITDDQPLVRAGLQALLRRDKEIEIVGEARDGQEAVQLAEKLCPDIILMDVKMPNLDGIEATRRIHSENDSSRILMVAMSYDEKSVRRALASGARGYVDKSSMTDELIPAVRAVHGGQRYFSSSVAALFPDLISGPFRQSN